MSDDHFNEKEANARAEKLLKGAFSGPPTPLKAIPKSDGESRSTKPKPKGK